MNDSSWFQFPSLGEHALLTGGLALAIAASGLLLLSRVLKRPQQWRWAVVGMAASYLFVSLGMDATQASGTAWLGLRYGLFLGSLGAFLMWRRARWLATRSRSDT